VPHFFTHAKYADKQCVFGICDGSATAAVEEYRRRFLLCKIPDRSAFSKVFNALRELGERSRQQHVEEQENILAIVQRDPTLSTRTLSTYIGVPRKLLWRTMQDDALHTFLSYREKNLYQGDNAMCLGFCHWLQIIANCFHSYYSLMKLLSPITDSKTNATLIHFFTRLHGIMKTNVQSNFSINFWCGEIDDMLIDLVILEDHMTRRNYLDVLQNRLSEQVEDCSSGHADCCATSACGAPVMQHLNDTFTGQSR
jgi:hypothetical protein